MLAFVCFASSGCFLIGATVGAVASRPLDSPAAPATTPRYCARSTNGKACFCAEVETECVARQERVTALGGVMGKCERFDVDACQSPPSTASGSGVYIGGALGLLLDIAAVTYVRSR